MKCLSLWQPWASALFVLDSHGIPIKLDETRCWHTNERGRIAIHAAKRKMPTPDAVPYIAALLECDLDWDTLPYGAIIGTTELVEVRTGPQAATLRTPEQLFWGDYRKFGDNGKLRYAFEMVNPQLLSKPLPYRGFQKIFEVPDEFLGSLPPAPFTESETSQMSLFF
jgi:hypothetical protein